ncbi:tail fiber domain-containing protein [Robbsia andropogonis]|uniref:tail fiber domain-containing protein n=1 Tax=Robbsia andropogonis TaxID=28092 RepID=UPI003D1BDDAD
MGGKSDTPSTPDPYATAAAQTQTNQQTAAYNKALNAGTINNPFGSSSQVQTGTDPTTGAPTYTTTTTGNDQVNSLISSLLGTAGSSNSSLQSALSGLSGLAGQYGNLNSSLSNLSSGLSGAYSSAQDAAQQGTDAYYNQAMAYLKPQQQQDTAALNSQLANQGLVPGTAAYNNASQNLSRSQTLANNTAMNSAITQGKQLGLNQLAGQEGLTSAQAGLLQDQASNLSNEGTTYGQLASASSLPYSQISALASLLPSSTNSTASADASNLSNDVYSSYSGALNSANAATGSSNSLMSGLFGLGSSVLGASPTSTIGKLISSIF